MPVTNQFRLCAIKIGNTFIGQITSQDVSDDITAFLARDSASIYNRAAAVDLEDVRARVTTQAIKTALGAVGLAGVSCAVSNAVLYFAKYTDGGAIDANGCVTMTIAKGLILWRSLSCSIGSLATMDIEVVGCSSDGVTSPVVVATGVALPTITTAEMYTLGSPAAIQNLSVDTGIQVLQRRGDKDAFYTLAAIEGCQPTVTYSLAAMGTLGAVTNLNTVTLQDVSLGGYRGSSPITLTFNQSFGNASRIGGSPTQTDYKLTPTWNGTNAPIVVSGLS